MALSEDNGYEREVVRTVREMTRQVEGLQKYVDVETIKLRAQIEGELIKLQAYVETLLQSYRKDTHLTTSTLQIDASDHKATHNADRIERTHRQWGLNVWLAALTIMGVVNIGMTLYLIGLLRALEGS